MLKFRKDNLQADRFDLRTSANRIAHYQHQNQATELIDKFNNYANKFETVLLVGNVPKSQIKLMDELDFDDVDLR